MLFIFSTCTNLVRTLPALQHDESNLEDLDSDGEDHAADALRYGLMSRPWVTHDSKPKKIKTLQDISYEEFITANTPKRKYGR